MSDEPSKTGNNDKRDKDEKKLLAKKKEKKEQNVNETKEKNEKALDQKLKSAKSAEQPSTSSRGRSKERTAEQSKKSASGHKRETKTKGDDQNKGDSRTKLEGSSTGVRKKRSGKMRRFFSLVSSDHDIDEEDSFHSAISASFLSLNPSSVFQSAISIDTAENLLKQRLAQHSALPSEPQGLFVQKPSQQKINEKQIEEGTISRSSLQTPKAETAIAQPPISKPSVHEVSVQTSLILTGQQLPIQVQSTGQSETPSKQLVQQVTSLEEKPHMESITEETPTAKEEQVHKLHHKRRFFEMNSSGISVELKEHVEPSPVKSVEAEEKQASKHSRKQYKLPSDISTHTADSAVSDGTIKLGDSNYDNDKGGYASEVDDVVDDSLKRRIKQRKEKEAREREASDKELSGTGSKDMGQKKSMRRLHSMSSRLETNLKVGTAFIYMIIPPDGGYAWIILVMSFLSQVIVDGIVFSIGILLPNMAQDLNADNATIALVVSIQIGCYFFSGPITSAFINKFGFRPVALTGVILAISSLSIASLSPNLHMLIVFYSLIGGPALSMIWVSSQLIIGYYFEKYRPIASGLSCSGAGAGLLIFSILNAELIPTVDWRNIMRLHIGILFCVLLISLTFIEVKPTKIAEMPEESETESDEEIEHITGSSRYTRPEIYKSLYNMRRGLGDNLVQMSSEHIVKTGRMEKCLISCCPAFGRYRRGSMTNIGEESKRFVIQTGPIERQDIYYTGPAAYDDRDDSSIVSIGGADVKMLSQRRKTIRTINYTLSMIQVAKQTRENRKKQKPQKNVCLEFLSFISPAQWLPLKVKRAFGILFDFRTLRIMEFKVLCISAVLFSTGFNIPFVYSKERSQIETFYKLMIPPAIGLSNLIFRIIAGFIAYKYKDYTTYICGGGILFGGIVTFISGFYGEDLLWFQFFYAFGYGVAPAFYSTLRSIIYVRYLGLENLTSGFGLTAMGMGFGVFIGTSTGGMLYEGTGNLSASFIFSGICLMLSGLLKLILPTITEWRKKRKSAKNKITSKV